MAVNNIGVCMCCEKEIHATGIISHLGRCRKLEKPNSGKEECELYTILLRDEIKTEYWMVIEVYETTKLSAIDTYLRKIWFKESELTSEFEIDGKKYSSKPSSDCLGMDISIKEAAKDITKLRYTHYFSSPTNLTVEIKRIERGIPYKRCVRLQARNKLPYNKCNICRRAMATNIIEDKDSTTILCDRCLDKARKGTSTVSLAHSLARPIINTPRM